jgi:hypothetical protein
MVGVKPTESDRVTLQKKLGEVDVDSALLGEVEKVQVLGATTGTTAMAQIYIYQPPEIPPQQPVPLIYATGTDHTRRNLD